MGEILGLGISHWPRLGQPDENLAILLRNTLKDPDIPVAAKDPANWPAPMRAEWGDDEGRAAAPAHRASMVRGLQRVRTKLDEFNPDAIVVWGDDQYENFREDIIPPFCVLGYQEAIETRPWGAMPNYWGENSETTFRVKNAPDIAKALVSGLIEESFDVAYAYKPLHHPGLPHAFLNTVLYLDYERQGFPYPLIPFQVNCYGRHVISHRGIGYRFADADIALDPPSPSPARCFDLGRAAARVMARSPWRIALVASSSWSHAFLCDKTWHLYPDVPSDRRLYEALVAGDYAAWRSTPLAAIEESGQHELLNWFCLVGAMSELGAKLEWSEFVETYAFNSDKVSAIFTPGNSVAPNAAPAGGAAVGVR